MGQTPPDNLCIRTTKTPRLEHWIVRLSVDREVESALAGPFADWPTAAAAWRLAGNYTRPVPADLEAWTLTHVDGWCGGDDAGCPHCRDIASRGTGPSFSERNVLMSRRNLPLGLGFLKADVDIYTRLRRLQETPA